MICIILAKLSNSASLGEWSNAQCSGYPTGVYTAFDDLCTARNGYAITASSCSDTNLKILVWEDSKNAEKVNAPQCATGRPSRIEASDVCTLLADKRWTKIIDSTCKAQTGTVFLASFSSSPCATKVSQTYSTIVADSKCRNFDFFSQASYSAKVVSSSIDFTYYDSSVYISPTCNSNLTYDYWKNVPTNGVCTASNDLFYYESILVRTPSAYYLSSSLAAAGAIGTIVGAIIGAICFCGGLGGILHVLRVVNIPCFNQCCDRRKNVVSSSAPSVMANVSSGSQKSSSSQPTYPSQYPSMQSQYAGGAQSQQPSYPQQPTQGYGQPSYGQQQPQYGQAAYSQRQVSSPYGNVRL